jgi:hypothetical protein
MRKRYYYEFGTDKHYTGAHEIMYAIGRVIGFLLMFGAGVFMGQIIRGFIMALLYGPAV